MDFVTSTSIYWKFILLYKTAISIIDEAELDYWVECPPGLQINITNYGDMLQILLEKWYIKPKHPTIFYRVY